MFPFQLKVFAWWHWLKCKFPTGKVWWFTVVPLKTENVCTTAQLCSTSIVGHTSHPNQMTPKMCLPPQPYLSSPRPGVLDPQPKLWGKLQHLTLELCLPPSLFGSLPNTQSKIPGSKERACIRWWFMSLQCSYTSAKLVVLWPYQTCT